MESKNNEGEVAQDADLSVILKEDYENIQTKAEGYISELEKATPEKDSEENSEVHEERKAWKHGSITKLSRRNIGQYQVEVHVDERGPHIHLNRGQRDEQYINLTNLTVEQGLEKLPRSIRNTDEIVKAAEDAINLWNQETKS